MRLIPAYILAATIALGGCSQGSTSAKISTPVTGPPAVRFIVPHSGAQITGGHVQVVVKFRGLLLSPTVGSTDQPGLGHLQFTFDGGKFDQPRYSGSAGRRAQRFGKAGKYSIALSSMITYRGIPNGNHTIRVALATNNFTTFGPRAVENVTVSGSAAHPHAKP